MTSKDFIKFCFDVGIKHFRIGQSIINKNHACNTYKFFHINMRKHCWKDIYGYRIIRTICYYI